MDRSSLTKAGVVVGIIALYLGVRISQDTPPQLQPQTPQLSPQQIANLKPPPDDVLQKVKKVDSVVGTGAEAHWGDTVSINYRGSLPNGKVFDSSDKHGQSFSFRLGFQVVPGFSIGILGMKVGGKRRMTIPPDLGYGNNPQPDSGIPIGATLIFDVELLQVTPP